MNLTSKIVNFLGINLTNPVAIFIIKGTFLCRLTGEFGTCSVRNI